MTEDLSKLELHYHQITDLYDLAEELVSTAEHPSIENPDDQLNLVEPLINQLGDSTDILSEEFIEIAGKQQKSTARRNSIESALRKIYTALDAYQQQVAQTAGHITTGLKNVADPIVEKIKRQVESVIAMLVEFVDISLDRIMHKQHIEELKQRQEKIAQMLYVAERQQSILGS
jgi:copper chaperone CopZ